MAKNNNTGGWSLALLRVVLGAMFILHGYAKLFVPSGFKGTVDFFTLIGIPFAKYSALLVASAEFFGGLLLILGLLTRWTALVLVIEMIVAFFKVHFKQGYFIMPPAYGYEFILLIIAALVVILSNGPGSLSLGKMLSKSKWLQ